MPTCVGNNQTFMSPAHQDKTHSWRTSLKLTQSWKGPPKHVIHVTSSSKSPQNAQIAMSPSEAVTSRPVFGKVWEESVRLLLRIVEKVRRPQSSKRQYKELPSVDAGHLSKHPRVYCEDDHSKKLVRTKESHFAVHPDVSLDRELPTARTMRPFRYHNCGGGDRGGKEKKEQKKQKVGLVKEMAKKQISMHHEILMRKKDSVDPEILVGMKSIYKIDR